MLTLWLTPENPFKGNVFQAINATNLSLSWMFTAAVIFWGKEFFACNPSLASFVSQVQASKKEWAIKSNVKTLWIYLPAFIISLKKLNLNSH